MAPAEGTKKTIIAIHGAGMHAGIWGGIMPHLLDYHMRAVTLPGHDIDRPSQPLTSIADMAAVIKDEMKSRDDGSVILMGHSMGALVSLEAAGHPAVSAVVVLGAAAEMPVNEDLLKMAAEKPGDANAMIAKWSVPSSSPAADGLRGLMAAIQSAADPKAVFADLAACDQYKTGAETVRALQKPLLVISGDKDKMVSSTGAHALADLAVKSRFEILNDCGHMAMIEQPIEAAALINDFLKENAGC